MAQTPSTPTHNNAGLSALFGAMGQTTPNFYLSPQLGGANGDFSNVDSFVSQSDGLFSLNQNTLKAIELYASQLGLTPEQVAGVTGAMRETEILRFGKLFTWIVALANKVDKIIVTQAPFHASPALKKNLRKLAVPLLLSPYLAAYKGNGPRNSMLTYIKNNNRFDIPVGIELNPTEFAMVKRECSEALTQVRSNLKKDIGASLGYSAQTNTLTLAATGRQNIFELAEEVTEDTNCVVTVELCARLALVRSVYFESWANNCPKLWDLVDERLASIREHANGNARMLTRAFRHLLDVDRSTHGINNYQIPDVTGDTIQMQFDNIIDAAAMNAASSVQVNGMDVEDGDH